MIHTIRKQFRFEAAHQLERAYSRECSDCIHGHSYLVEMFLRSRSLDGDDMVVDFGRLGPFKEAIMRKLDHGLMLHENKRELYHPLIEAGHLAKEKVSFWPANPTAELLAQYIFEQLNIYVTQSMSPSVWVHAVRVHETSTGYAEYKENQ